MKHKGYRGTSEYIAKDGCFHGQIVFIKDLVTYEGKSLEEIEMAFKEAVDEYIEHCEEADRVSSGN